jgi:hypothetical protein
VKADLDATTFTSGADQAAAAMEGLATTTQTAATDIDTALVSDVPASVDSSAVAVTTKASRFKAVGAELGTNLAGGVANAASSGQAVSGLLSSVGGLVAPLAATGGGAIAAIGLGLGGALVGNIIEGINARSEAFNAAVDDLLSNLGDDFRGQIKKIMDDLKSSITEVNVLTKFGGGSLTEGLAHAKTEANLLGLSLDDVVKILEGRTDPATQAIVDHWRQVGVETQKVLDDQGTLTQEQGAYVAGGDDLVTAYDTLRGEIKQAKSNTNDLRGVQQDLAFQSAHYALNMERGAAAAADAAASSQAIAAGIANAAASMSGSRWLYRLTH